MPRAAVLIALLLLAPPAAADTRDVAGRGFTLARPPGEVSESVAASPDGTVWTLGEGEGAWRLAPTALAFVRVARAHTFVDLAAARDGSVLLAEDVTGTVWRRAPDGTLAPVAGGRPYDEPGLSVTDGGPATRTRICSAGQVAALPDGGFVFADRYGQSLRRVAPDGTISTVLGEASYACPDSFAAPHEVIRDVAVDRSGAIVLVMTPGALSTGRDRLLRLVPGGAPVVIRGGLAIRSVAVAADGALLTTGGRAAQLALRRLVPGTTRTTIVMGAASAEDVTPFFDYDGLLARQWRMVDVAGSAAMPDGGIVASAESLDGPDSLVYVPPRRPGRLAAALDLRGGRATTRGYTVSARVTRPGRAALVVVGRRGRVVARTVRTVRTGRSTLSVGRGLRFGTYEVRLTVTGKDGQRARDTAKLVLGGALPFGYARGLVVPEVVDIGGGCSNCEVEEVPTRLVGCRAIGSRIVGCRYTYEGECQIGWARLRVDGTLETGRSECLRARGVPARMPALDPSGRLPRQP